jgi:hypothetical protein
MDKIARPLGIVENIGDQHLPLWYYNYVPEGMREAKPEEIHYGLLVLHKCVLSEGYHTLYVDDQDIPILKNNIRAGYPVYVKNSSINNK